MKTIGLIGGMSWHSTAHYYAAINTHVTKRLGKHHSAPIVLHSLDFEPIVEMQNEQDWPKAAVLLCDSARRLQMAGADLFAIATNTMHVVANQVQDAVSIPLIHIAAPTAFQLRADGFSKVGLLGTQFTMEMNFFTSVLEQQGLSVIIPDVDVTNLNAIIYDELCQGIVRDQSRQIYVAAVQRLMQRGAEAVILGCTEIGMLIGDDDCPIPTYDTTQLHAKALVDFALVE